MPGPLIGLDATEMMPVGGEEEEEVGEWDVGTVTIRGKYFKEAVNELQMWLRH